MGRRFRSLGLDEGERRELTSLASRRSTAQGLAQRARIILACADGEQSKVVAARLGRVSLDHRFFCCGARLRSWPECEFLAGLRIVGSSGEIGKLLADLTTAAPDLSGRPSSFIVNF